MPDVKNDPTPEELDEMRDTHRMNSREILAYRDVVIDNQLLDEDDDFSTEERQRLFTNYSALQASIVFRDDDLAFVELEWPSASGLVFPATPEVVNAVHQNAAEQGYSLKLLLRRGLSALDQGRNVERHIVIFDPEPEEGDGKGVTIELRLGIDVTDEDYGHPKKAVLKKERWIARVTELVKQTYPRAQLHVEEVDDEADEVTVSTPLGFDPTDFEWVIEDLIEQATDEILEPNAGL